MATVNIVRAAVDSRALTSSTVPVPSAVPLNSETITSNSGSQPTTDAAEAETDFWIISVAGGNVWLNFGPTPEASANNDWLVLDGQTREFGARVGEKVAVINA